MPAMKTTMLSEPRLGQGPKAENVPPPGALSPTAGICPGTVRRDEQHRFLVVVTQSEMGAMANSDRRREQSAHTWRRREVPLGVTSVALCNRRRPVNFPLCPVSDGGCVAVQYV